jgi:hypothetical protein
MLMSNGDDCGSHGSRRTKIKLTCNNDTTNFNHTLGDITEPATCNYEIKLITPLACESIENGWTMNVYPCLNESLKSEWDMVYSQFSKNLISEKVIQFVDFNFSYIFQFFFVHK